MLLQLLSRVCFVLGVEDEELRMRRSGRGEKEIETSARSNVG